ncbi:MAG: hypothetical protein F6K04_08675, partial [Leptolyngbya sp. SIO4C5]|nr:hypothetical protein [Leptolyngbya sp. SIO4C5]
NRIGLNNGAAITVEHESTGRAGNAFINAGVIAVNNQSTITAETVSSDGGNVNLEGFFVVLGNDGQITTTARTQSNNTGGDINLAIQDIIFGTPSRNNDIRADSEGGEGGNVRFVMGTSPALRNIAIRDRPSPLSNDITATGRTPDQAGTISGSTANSDPVQEAVELPADLIDASRLIAQGCAAGNLTAAREIGELTITGRGGLDPTPSEQIGEASLATDIGELPGEPTAIAPHPTPPPPPVTAAAPVIEAQSWQYGPDGEVILTADASSVLPYSPAFTTPTCNDWQTSRS